MFGRFGPGYLHSDAITFRDTSVLKKVNPTLAALEAEVTRAAHNLGQDCAMFTAPRVLRYDSSAGTIEFERIEELVTIGHLLNEEHDNLDMLHRIGRILAFVHEHLYLPPYLRRPAPAHWHSPIGDVVALHGDFNTMNVAYKPDADSVVLLDWASARVLGRGITVGPRYLDLAQFLRSLVVHQADYFGAIRQFRRRARAFLDGYREQLDRSLDARLLKDFLLRIGAARLRELLRRPVQCRQLVHAAFGLLGQAVFRSAAGQWIRRPQACSSTARRFAIERRLARCA